MADRATVLEVINTIQASLGLPVSSDAVGSSDALAIQLVALMEDELRYLRGVIDWPELIRAGSITLEDGTADYSLPADCDKIISETVFDRDGNQKVKAITPQGYQKELARGTVSSSHDRWRIQGVSRGKETSSNERSSSYYFKIFPTPTSGDDGDVRYFEYLSKSVARPKNWVAAEYYGSTTWCSNSNGDIYYSTGGGTTGGTEPTHTTGSASDGGVTWIYQDVAYNKFKDDEDWIVLDPALIILGTKKRFFEAKGLPGSESVIAEYREVLTRERARLQSVDTISMAGRSNEFKLMDETNIPDYIG